MPFPNKLKIVVRALCICILLGVAVLVALQAGVLVAAVCLIGFALGGWTVISGRTPKDKAA